MNGQRDTCSDSIHLCSENANYFYLTAFVDFSGGNPRRSWISYWTITDRWLAS